MTEDPVLETFDPKWWSSGKMLEYYPSNGDSCPGKTTKKRSKTT